MTETEIQKAERLYEALTGKDAQLTNDLATVLAKVTPETPVLVEIPWGEMRQGELHDRHQIILTHVAGERIYFINALKTPAKPGETLGGPGKGPQRRFEANGEESMPLGQFQGIFRQGGRAMIS